MRRRRYEKVKPRELGPSQGFDSSTHSYQTEGPNVENFATSMGSCQAGAPDPAFERFMRAAQPSQAWPLTSVPPEAWSLLPVEAQQAIDSMAANALWFWISQGPEVR